MPRHKLEVPGSKSPSAATAADQPSAIPDALQWLSADHKTVKGHFEHYQKLVDEDADSKELTGLAHKICHSLSVHARIEEELLYPLLRKYFDTTELIDEAAVEHATVKSLIEQIIAGNRRDALYDAKVKVLGEYVEHHVQEEEGQIFPKAKKLNLDLMALGEAMAARETEIGAASMSPKAKSGGPS